MSGDDAPIVNEAEEYAMGFTGAWLVACVPTDAPAASGPGGIQLPAGPVEVGATPAETRVLDSGYVQWRYTGVIPSLGDGAVALGESGSAVLLGMCLDEACVIVQGASTSGSSWAGCLGAEAATSVLGDIDPEAAAEMVAPPDVAVAGAVGWAKEAGLAPDETVLKGLFALPTGGVAQWDAFVRAMGLTARA